MLSLLKRTGQALAIALAVLLNPLSAKAATELTMYYPVAVGGPLTKIVDELVAGFMKENPDIKVNAIYAGNYNDARIKALAALNSGQPAQLSVMFSIDIYELIEQDAIVAFDDVVSSVEDKAWLDSFYSTLMQNGRTAGKTWGIPFQRSTIVMYYNKDMFREAGLDPENPPATWDELVAAGKKLTKARRVAMGHDDPVHRLPLLDVWCIDHAERPGADERRRRRNLFSTSRPPSKPSTSGRRLAASTRSCPKAPLNGERFARTSWKARPPSCGIRPAT